MEKVTIKQVRDKFRMVLADIAQNQRGNRERLYDEFRVIEKIDTKLDEKGQRIQKLLHDYEHYFDEGYWCALTPERLKDEIEKELQ